MRQTISQQRRVPEKLIQTVCGHLVDSYLPGRQLKNKADLNFSDKDLRYFSKGVLDLSLSFTRDRATLPKNYLNMKEFRSAYILYFIISNYLKAHYCLHLARNHQMKKVKILDIGCGPGTALLAAADTFDDVNLELTGADQNKHILTDARKLLKRYAGLDIRTVLATMSTNNTKNALGDEKFDIIIFCNILGEFHKLDDRKKLVLALFKNHLNHDGRIIIIEPALQRMTRELMMLRDLLLNAGKMQIIAPCLHNNPCPMLRENRRDWCHMYLEWQRPLLIEKTDRLIGNRKDYLKFSYLIVERGQVLTLDKLTCPTSIPDPFLWRVVSAPIISRGKKEWLICGDAGLKRLVRLDRDRSEANSDLDLLMRGDLLRHSGPFRITKTSRCTKAA